VTPEQTIDIWIRDHLGAQVISITRQARWRAAWLVDVERDGYPLPLVVRGERSGHPDAVSAASRNVAAENPCRARTVE
jgi:hypothetical protein